MTRLLALSLLALVPAVTGADDAAPTYLLRYKFSPGEIVKSEIVHQAEVQTTVQGTGQTTETRSTSIRQWKVLAVEPSGRIQIEHSVESIDLWQKMQGRAEVTYNSRTDATPPAGYEDAAKAVGIPLTVLTIDSTGKILHREDKHAQPSGQEPPMVVPLPAEPVAVGHVWSAPQDIDVLLAGGATRKIQTRQRFELIEVALGLAKISVQTQVLTPVSDPSIEAQLIQRLSEGEIKFDIDAGRVAGQELDLDRKVSGFSGPASSMHYQTRFTEKLLPSEPQTARRPRGQ